MANDARSKLRSMGGIMASSPELAQVAQKFQAGGPVMGMPQAAPAGPNVFPRRPPAPTPGLRPTGLQVPPLAGTTPLVPRDVSLREDLKNSPELRRQILSGRAPDFGPGARSGLGSFDPVDELLENSSAATPRPDPETMPEKPEDKKNLSPSIRRQNEIRAKRGLPPLSAEQEKEFRGSEQAAPLAQDVARSQAIDDELAAIEGRKIGGVFASSADAAAADKLQKEKRDLDVAAGETLSAEETVMEQSLVPKPLSQEQIDKAMEVVKKDPSLSFLTGEDTADTADTADTGDGGTDTGDGDTTPPPGGGKKTKPTKRDLRSRYNEKIELFKEIYGTDDKDEAQERAMSLAMIGLAIAAGQSPNALTNIAQGAMAGLQGMGERQDAERERERGLRTLALQTAIDEQAGEASAEAEAAQMDQEQRNKLQLEEFKAQLGSMYGGAGGSRDARNIIDFAQNAYTNAFEAASSMQAADFDSDAETPHEYAMRQARAAAGGIGQMFPGYGGGAATGAPTSVPTAPESPEVPSITTREEYDALPSGSQFMQGGQMRVKP